MSEIARILPGGWRAFRTIRLAALADSPGAFAVTLADASAQPDSFWRERARTGSHGDTSAIFVARDVGEPVGVVAGYRQRPTDSVVQLVSMWVAPAARRTGLGRRLVESVVAWARASNAESVELWVTVGNDAARKLYESCGFIEVGDYQPLPSDPCQNETRMRLTLPG